MSLHQGLVSITPEQGVTALEASMARLNDGLNKAVVLAALTSIEEYPGLTAILDRINQEAYGNPQLSDEESLGIVVGSVAMLSALLELAELEKQQ